MFAGAGTVVDPLSEGKLGAATDAAPGSLRAGGAAALTAAFFDVENDGALASVTAEASLVLRLSPPY
jgi:hypothetical protein